MSVFLLDVHITIASFSWLACSGNNKPLALSYPQLMISRRAEVEMLMRFINFLEQQDIAVKFMRVYSLLLRTVWSFWIESTGFIVSPLHEDPRFSEL